MTRWIIFEGAPTAEQAIAACKRPRTAHSGSWTALNFQLGFRSTDNAVSTNERLKVQPTTARHPDMSSLGEAGDLSADEREDEIAGTPSEEGDLSVEEECEADHHSRTAFQHGKNEGTLLDQSVQGGADRSLLSRVKEEEGDSGFSSVDMLPPPAQRRRRSSRVNPSDVSAATSHRDSTAFHANPPPDPSDPSNSRFSTTYAEDDSYEYTSRSYAVETGAGGSGGIGGAPEFPFRRRDLVPLSEMYTRQKAGQPVSVLASVWTMRQFETAGMTRHEWSLLDSSGQNLPLIIWGGDYSGNARQVRIGDIIFLGGISVDAWQGKLQLKYRRTTTKIHVCWRTTVVDPEDRQFRFHRDWGKEIPEAAAVLKEVDFAAARLS
ncbi:hypothetical protein JCM10908_004395 [Rhodotorula pacifica]|uniref:uncharacterized protein n=1 Tax=Rhodotorula pacifica TaxID=1495444 RepID=UPI00317FCE4B